MLGTILNIKVLMCHSHTVTGYYLKTWLVFFLNENSQLSFIFNTEVSQQKVLVLLESLNYK